MGEPAIVLANGMFRTSNAKTSHGLVRSSRRFDVVGLIDASCAGEDAGELLDGRRRQIPIFASVGAALSAAARTPRYCIVGVATSGGVLPSDLRRSLAEAVEAGLTLVNGLHHLLGDDAEIGPLAAEKGVEIIDIRRPRPTKELRFWSGAITGVRAARIPVLGTDCAVGKRTTCVLLRDACAKAGLRAEMVYTGQTGWLQGERYGFILDSTPNDFVCGELERAIVECDRNERPDVIFMEGQSALRNPSGPCGAELLLAAAAAGAVLQHPAGREFYIDNELGQRIPSVESEIELIAAYGVDVWAVTLNDEGMTRQAAEAVRDTLATRLSIPVVLPLTDGVDAVVQAIRRNVGTRPS